MVQLILGVLTCVAITLVIFEKTLPGCIFGLLSQPFWLIETMRAKQWGMFSVSILITFSWIIGIVRSKKK